MDPFNKLSRRHREVMEAVYRLDLASCAEIQAELVDPPSYSAVRAMARTLTERGLLRCEKHGRKYLYSAAMPASKARRKAVQRMLSTFFDGSVSAAIVSLLSQSDEELDGDSVREIERLLRERTQSTKRRGT